MKNKLMILFVILLSIFVVSSITVQAEGEDTDTNTDSDVAEGDTTEGEETTSTSWALDYTTDRFNYTIEGVTLKIYKIDDSKTTTETKTTETGTEKITKNPDTLAYVNGIATKTIELKKEDYTLNPELKTDKLGKMNTSFINLNLDLTKEKLETLLQEEIDSTTDDINYMVEVVLNYKITKYPENYKHFLNLNTMHFLMGSIMGIIGEEVTYTPETSIDNSLSQVINFAIIKKDTESTSGKLYYDTELSDENNVVAYIYNPLILSEEEIKMEISSDSDMANTDKSEYLLFHNVNNIQYLIDNINNIEKQANEEAEEQVKDLEVQVPNTALNRSIVWSMLGIVTLLTGIMLIMYAKKMKQFRKIEYLGED